MKLHEAMFDALALDGYSVRAERRMRTEDRRMEHERDEYVSPEAEAAFRSLASMHTGSEDESTTMSNNGRTEALKLVVETRDWFRNEVEVGDEMLVLWVRKLDKAIDLLTKEA